MAWILGIDEAGYGPNLGPFVMSAVACRLPDEQASSCLWQSLQSVVRRAGGANRKDTRILVDDSKAVYSSAKGLAGLERGLFALFDFPPSTLNELLHRLCPDNYHDLESERWYTGRTQLPIDLEPRPDPLREKLTQACQAAGLTQRLVYSTIVCPTRFNALVELAGSKSAVLACAFVQLLQHGITTIAGTDSLAVFVDKQGGRNTYAPQVQQALGNEADRRAQRDNKPIVVVLEESMNRSAYQVKGLDRPIQLTFQPRADQQHFCVALASMVSKYLRELFMGEFNRFWQQHVPGLKATAGYPADAPRFLEAIRPAALNLHIPEAAIWRQK